MNSLHLALLILAIVVLVALYLVGRAKANAGRPKRRAKAPLPPDSAATEPSEQMDLWKTDSGCFDELGVGQPRRRGAPRLDPILTGEAPLAKEPAREEPAPPVASRRPADKAPRAEPAPPPGPAPAAEAEPPQRQTEPVEEKIVAMYVAEREGTYIDGVQIHRALRRAGLRYGEKMKIYERVDAAGGSGRAVFGVASLLKPGHLDPAEASRFSTPGLSMFMVLPGPLPAESAFDDFLATGRELAAALNAELYDSARAPLSDEIAAKMRADIRDWAARTQ